jgi:hypothetical protein
LDLPFLLNSIWQTKYCHYGYLSISLILVYIIYCDM